MIEFLVIDAFDGLWIEWFDTARVDLWQVLYDAEIVYIEDRQLVRARCNGVWIVGLHKRRIYSRPPQQLRFDFPPSRVRELSFRQVFRYRVQSHMSENTALDRYTWRIVKWFVVGL